MTEPRPDWLDDADTDGLPDPPEPTLPKRFEDIDPDDAFVAMIDAMRSALNRLDDRDLNPFELAYELDRYCDGMRLAWLRTFAYLCGPARVAEASALALEARFADEYGPGVEPGVNHVTARTALASAIAYMTQDARDRGE